MKSFNKIFLIVSIISALFSLQYAIAGGPPSSVASQSSNSRLERCEQIRYLKYLGEIDQAREHMMDWNRQNPHDPISWTEL